MASIVFGLEPAGLFIIRELVKTGEKVYAVGKKDDIGRYSRHGHKFFAETKNEIVNVVNKIIQAAGGKTGHQIKAYIASSIYLDLIIREWPELFELVEVVGPDYPIMKALNQKTEAYKFFSQFGIEAPRTFLYKNYKDMHRFPAILKWNCSIYNSYKYRDFFDKTLIVKNEQALNLLVETLKPALTADVDNLILQEFVGGEEIRELGYGAYYQNGKEVAGIVVEQLRQWPRGISSYIIEISDKETDQFRSKVQQALAAIKYTGFIQFDLLADDQSGNRLLLDVNPRPWASIKVLSKKYIGFHNLLGDSDWENKVRVHPEKVRWLDIHRDLIAICIRLFRYRSAHILFQDLRSIFHKHTSWNVYELDDMAVLLGVIRKSIKISAKRLFTRHKMPSAIPLKKVSDISY